jgi:hypothetical protein
VGCFKDGYFSGHGTMIYKCIESRTILGISDMEATYKGEWKLGRKHGKGTIKWTDGNKFKGFWQNDMRVKGKYKMRDGVIYNGEFKNNMFHGKGKLTITKLDLEFSGVFKDGI